MGLIARLLSFTSRRATLDPGGGENLTAEHFADPGDDSQPLSEDRCATTRTQPTGGQAAVGYRDSRNPGRAGPGEKRIYSRNLGGVQQAEIWLRNTGEIRASNAVGSITLAPSGAITITNGPGSFVMAAGGTVTINNVTFSPAGAVASPVSLAAPSVRAGADEMADHTHPAGALRDSQGGACTGNTGSV